MYDSRPDRKETAMNDIGRPTCTALGVRGRRVALALAALTTATLSPVSTWAATYRVVDGDTGEPLEGAVMVVVWRTPRRLDLQGRAVPFQALERITGPDGKVAGDVPSPQAERRDVTVYKPGYRPLRASTRDQSAPLFRETVIPLAKVTTFQEARVTRNIGDLGVEICEGGRTWGCVRSQDVSRLLRLFAIHRKVYFPRSAGLPEDER